MNDVMLNGIRRRNWSVLVFLLDTPFVIEVRTTLTIAEIALEAEAAKLKESAEAV